MFEHCALTSEWILLQFEINIFVYKYLVLDRWICDFVCCGIFRVGIFCGLSLWTKSSGLGQSYMGWKLFSDASIWKVEMGGFVYIYLVGEILFNGGFRFDYKFERSGWAILGLKYTLVCSTFKNVNCSRHDFSQWVDVSCVHNVWCVVWESSGLPGDPVWPLQLQLAYGTWRIRRAVK